MPDNHTRCLELQAIFESEISNCKEAIESHTASIIEQNWSNLRSAVSYNWNDFAENFITFYTEQFLNINEIIPIPETLQLFNKIKDEVCP